MNCLKFRENTVIPENVYMDPIEFFNLYYTSCDMKEVKNTAFMILEGVGTFAKHRIIKNEVTNTVMEMLNYNEHNRNPITMTIENAFNALHDLKALKKRADLSMGLELNVINRASKFNALNKSISDERDARVALQRDYDNRLEGIRADLQTQLDQNKVLRFEPSLYQVSMFY
jgi:hypothetical protein